MVLKLRISFGLRCGSSCFIFSMTNTDYEPGVSCYSRTLTVVRVALRSVWYVRALIQEDMGYNSGQRWLPGTKFTAYKLAEHPDYQRLNRTPDSERYIEGSGNSSRSWQQPSVTGEGKYANKKNLA